MLPDMPPDASHMHGPPRAAGGGAARAGSLVLRDLYEALVGMPNSWTAARLQRAPRLLGAGSPIRYYVPAAPLTLVATTATLIDGWQSGGEKNARSLSPRRHGNGHRPERPPHSHSQPALLHGDEPLSPSERHRLVTASHRTNVVRLIALAIASRSLRRPRRFVVHP